MVATTGGSTGKYWDKLLVERKSLAKVSQTAV
jgi:hypothetical protein